MNRTADVVIIGAGVIGSSTAFELSKRGYKTLNAREVYRADGVDFSLEAEESIRLLEENGLSDLPICMAKTQSSLSDDPKKRNAPRGWRLQVRDLKVSNGAGFIVVMTGKMMLMPGMPRDAAFSRIDIDENGRISGLS